MSKNKQVQIIINYELNSPEPSKNLDIGTQQKRKQSDVTKPDYLLTNN